MTDFSNNVTSFAELAQAAAAKKKETAAQQLPYVSMGDCSFELLGVDFQYRWTEEVEKATGKTKKKRTNDLELSDDGTQARIKVQFVVTDAHGHSTSRKAPFTGYAWATNEQVGKLLESINDTVQLVNPRIVLKDVGKADDKFKGVETKLSFAFDGFDL